METYGLSALGGGKNSLGPNGHFQEVEKAIERLGFGEGLDVVGLQRARVTMENLGFVKGRNFRLTMLDDSEDEVW